MTFNVSTLHILVINLFVKKWFYALLPDIILYSLVSWMTIRKCEMDITLVDDLLLDNLIGQHENGRYYTLDEYYHGFTEEELILLNECDMLPLTQ